MVIIKVVGKTKEILVGLPEDWRVKVRGLAMFENFVLKPLIKKENLTDMRR